MARNIRVNQSHFAMIPQANIRRSVFDRSHVYKTTFNEGQLIPYFVDEVIPGDTFTLNPVEFCRLATPVVPFMDNIYLESFFFFVPSRLVYDKWVNLCGEQENPEDSTDYLVPTVSLTGDMTNKLAAESYNDNLALVKQNLVNAQKQGEYIDAQKASQMYMMNVVMPAQAAMMYAQGNAANSSAAYNSQLSNVAKADYDYKTSRNKDYKDLGLSDDGLPWNTVGRAANRLFSGISNFFSK
jgi:hypothetical protein